MNLFKSSKMCSNCILHILIIKLDQSKLRLSLPEKTVFGYGPKEKSIFILVIKYRPFCTVTYDDRAEMFCHSSNRFHSIRASRS